MCERDNLLASIASTINTYREGEIATPDPQHVDRWANQFSQESQTVFLREIDHVLKQTFITKGAVTRFLGEVASSEALAGNNPAGYWSSANILTIQQKGQSQREMVDLFDNVLQNSFGLELDKCGVPGGDFIYLDDVLFTGGRVATDLIAWIRNDAPPQARVHIILMAIHTSGHYYIEETRLKKAIDESGKEISLQFWSEVSIENKLYKKDYSSVLWPVETPNNEAVKAYIDTQKHFVARNAGGRFPLFSGEEGRQTLEREFLIAGVEIRSKATSPNDFTRPLGCGPFGVGFGSMIATYRNCPNNAPLALWWGELENGSGALDWYPLMPRKTYSTPENMFNGLFK